jgi:hypothetical protein
MDLTIISISVNGRWRCHSEGSATILPVTVIFLNHSDSQSRTMASHEARNQSGKNQHLPPHLYQSSTSSCNYNLQVMSKIQLLKK